VAAAAVERRLKEQAAQAGADRRAFELERQQWQSTKRNYDQQLKLVSNDLDQLQKVMQSNERELKRVIATKHDELAKLSKRVEDGKVEYDRLVEEKEEWKKRAADSERAVQKMDHEIDAVSVLAFPLRPSPLPSSAFMPCFRFSFTHDSCRRPNTSSDSLRHCGKANASKW